jgi:galactose mutarotase-like enzyme
MNDLIIRTEKSQLTAIQKGGYVINWKIKKDGIWHDMLYQGSELKRTGIPILFPQFGKSEFLPQHGFARDSDWKFLDQTETTISMQLDKYWANQEMTNGYKYDYEAQIDLTLEEDSFIYQLTVRNVGDKTLPISPGLHPYWEVKHDLKKEVTIEGIEGFDAKEFDWDNNPPDHYYKFEKVVRIHLPDKIISIKDLSGECQNIVVWSQPLEKPDHDFICVEPVTRVNYGLEENPITIKPGESWEMKLRFSAELK